MQSATEIAYLLVIILPTTNEGTSLKQHVEGILQELCKVFGGFTATQSVGGWENEGTLQVEPVMRVEVVTTDLTRAKAIVENLRHDKVLNQEQIFSWVNLLS